MIEELIIEAIKLEEDFPPSQFPCAQRLAHKLGKPFLAINQLRQLAKCPEALRPLFVSGRLPISQLSVVASANDPFGAARDLEHRLSLAYRLCPHHIFTIARNCLKQFNGSMAKGGQTSLITTRLERWQGEYAKQIDATLIDPAVRELVEMSVCDRGGINIAELGLTALVLYSGSLITISFELCDSGKDSCEERGRP